ncbi:amidohydrolase family protein [Microbacterium sp. A93]|uniref:amidohydrolase family protein n=1 Tax=Microbacterium sp. A93 TaxID=3450716 RepID=UPI003F43521A
MISCVINAEVDGRPGQRLILRGGVIEDIDSARAPVGATVIDAHGGAVVSGLSDHHLHVRSTAARRLSIEVGDVRDRDEFASRLRGHPSVSVTMRFVGYDSDRLGQLSLDVLESLAPNSPPMRVQHRSGHHWVLNAAARTQLIALGFDVPRDGILWDQDAALAAFPSILTDADVTAEFRRMRAQGIVRASDLTATNRDADATALRAAAAGVVELTVFGAPDAGLDGVKFLVHDHLGITPDRIVEAIQAAGGAPVALHTVTDAALALSLAACEDAARDAAAVRFEHAFICSPDAIPVLANSGATVGAHPGFFVTQGDRLVRALTNGEQRNYQPLRSLIDAGIALYGGTDAPYGTANIWKAMQAAVDRRTPGGSVIAAEQALTPEEAIDLFSPAGAHSDAPHPTVQIGDSSLVVLDRPWHVARSALGSTTVTAVLSGHWRHALRRT